jgi:hypothetical protein
MFLAEGTHGVYGLAPAFSFFLAQNRFFPGDGFESAFDDFFGGAADAASERGLHEFFAMGGEGDLHGGRIARREGVR